MELVTAVGRPLIAERIAGSGKRAVLACGKTVTKLRLGSWSLVDTASLIYARDVLDGAGCRLARRFVIQIVS
jgi:hypothetical protein